MIQILDHHDLISGKDPGGFSAQLGRACRTEGVFQLKGHGIPRGLLRDVIASAEEFFALPEEDKAPLDIRHSNCNRGWAGMGVERLGGQDGTPLSKESFSIGLDLRPDDPRVLAGEPFRGPNVWPDCDQFRDVMRDYFKEMLGLGRSLMRAVESDLDLPKDFFKPHFSEPNATLRLSHTPADGWHHEVPSDQPQFDYGALTLVLSDGVAGLQVQNRAGRWYDIPDTPDTLTVLVGEELMRWSNDLYRAAPHRVLPPVQPRTLAAFYLDPNPESVIAPLPGLGAPQYPPVRAADYLRVRLEQTYMPLASGQG
ncbi:isopenicillin N synthase family dioxygenase [Celeribacter sp.]|uniref:isopenicillin N synthase family dioxygenase n=1 Tax=Celeribacter sp. TaxID=1890673 RepID=UPI003A901E9E